MSGHTDWDLFQGCDLDYLETFSVLLAFNGGSEAIEMESMTDEEITAEAMTILRGRPAPGPERPVVYSGSLGYFLAESGISTLGSFLETQM